MRKSPTLSDFKALSREQQLSTLVRAGQLLPKQPGGMDVYELGDYFVGVTLAERPLAVVDVETFVERPTT